MFYRDAYPKPVSPAPPRPRNVASLSWFIPANRAAVRTINAAVRDPWSDEKLDGLIDDRSAAKMVAQRGCVVAAFMSYRVGPTGIDLLYFAVAPQHRNLGVGSQLFRALDAKLAAYDRSRLTAAISELDVSTWRWFVRRGMRGVGVERDGVRPGVDRWRFEFLASDPTAVGQQNCPSGQNDIP
jgi:[ribosomal protein S18]-alanine N-acetyltransferase